MSPAGHHCGGVVEVGRYLSCLHNQAKRLGQGVKSPTGKPCPSEDAVGGPWRPCALLFPTRARGRPSMPCCPEAPKRARGPWPGPVHLENPESRPPGLPAALLPPGCAPPGADSRLLTGYSPTEPPLLLIPFLFGFNVPNPLSLHGDRGRRTVSAGVWGKSRRMTGGPGWGGAGIPPSARAPHLILKRVWGQWPRLTDPDTGLGGLVLEHGRGRQSLPQIIPGPSDQCPAPCLHALCQGRTGECVGLQRGPSNPRT